MSEFIPVASAGRKRTAALRASAAPAPAQAAHPGRRHQVTPGLEPRPRAVDARRVSTRGGGAYRARRGRQRADRSSFGYAQAASHVDDAHSLEPLHRPRPGRAVCSQLVHVEDAAVGGRRRSPMTRTPAARAACDEARAAPRGGTPNFEAAAGGAYVCVMAAADAGVDRAGRSHVRAKAPARY